MCVHRDLPFRLISFTHERALLSRAILISVSVPSQTIRKRIGKGTGTDLRLSFTCDLIRLDVINGQDIRIRLEPPIWLTTHETVITPPRRLNLMYKGTGIDHVGRKSTIVSILNMRHPAALDNEVALRCADVFYNSIRCQRSSSRLRCLIALAAPDSFPVSTCNVSLHDEKLFFDAGDRKLQFSILFNLICLS